eukprot:11981257-Heterocapsa_arctica.AAC.1
MASRTKMYARRWLKSMRNLGGILPWAYSGTPEASAGKRTKPQPLGDHESGTASGRDGLCSHSLMMKKASA